REARLSACADSPDACDVVSIWIDSLAIGDWDTEKATLHDARVRRALDRRSAAMKTLLRTTLGSAQRPVVPPQCPRSALPAVERPTTRALPGGRRASGR